jgi:hypothetical protein
MHSDWAVCRDANVVEMCTLDASRRALRDRVECPRILTGRTCQGQRNRLHGFASSSLSLLPQGDVATPTPPHDTVVVPDLATPENGIEVGVDS